MAYFRQGVHGRARLWRSRLSIRTGENTYIVVPRDGNNTSLVLYHHIWWQGDYEKPTTIEAQRAVHASQLLLDGNQRGTAVPVRRAALTYRLAERNLLRHLQS